VPRVLAKLVGLCAISFPLVGATYSPHVPAAGSPGGPGITVSVCLWSAVDEICGPSKGKGTSPAKRKLGGRRVATLKAKGVGLFSQDVRNAGSVTIDTGAAKIACPEDCSADVPVGTTVTIRAFPKDPGYYVLKTWRGACTGSQDTCKVKIVGPGPQTVTAAFSRT
jgi:hypothetical protein